ncbi:GNAT family N-acetyltransferase [Roseivirga sp. BDSF3-8]|uniref:GNAT family N-acetyltransferase n=1 Tax=Roseivirga sp. BDSF3-8 TaxID=3241598 RepID=UPI00353195B3
MAQADFLITTERVGLRPWLEGDIPAMAAISGDREVMRFFPAPATYKQTEEFIHRMQKSYTDRGYCYFPVFLLATKRLIGFTGLLYQTYEGLPFMPCTDVGWRLDKSVWGKGLATEAARACLTFGFENCRLNTIYATCPQVNTPSERVMKKLGMSRQGTFMHPRLKDAPHLQPCVYYSVDKERTRS